ncbi:MAG: hypothetical protein ACRBCI_06810 [Cellvibrionaceae bacterium]
MININSLTPPVNTPKVKKMTSKSAAVAGTEINKDAQRVFVDQQKKRRGKDRRKKNMKPLIDLRSGRDRRDDPNIPSIDIEV